MVVKIAGFVLAGVMWELVHQAVVAQLSDPSFRTVGALSDLLV